VSGWEAIRDGYAQYLQDESRLTAERLEAIHFPTTADQIALAVRSARRAGHRLAVSGARTGVTGAAVPIGAEELISLERAKATPLVRRHADGNWSVRVRAGTTLAELADALDHGLCEYPDGKPDLPLFYPVDATETSAQLGGTIATNASGARTLHYGPTRRWVRWLKVVTADGRILELARGRVRAKDGLLLYRREDGTPAEVRVPDLPRPRTKHTAGYHLAQDMDAVDLFVGSEGTLGIVAEAELGLAQKPANRLFLTQFLPGPQEAVELMAAVAAEACLAPLAAEYIGPEPMALLRSMGRRTPAYVEVSRLPEDLAAALYVEFPFADEAQLDATYAALRELLLAAALDPDCSWAGFAEQDMDQMKRLRHAVPETVNAIIGQRRSRAPVLHKLSTDMAVPVESLGAMLRFYRRRLTESGLEFVIFGHIGDGHLHVNVLPRAAGEMAQAEELYLEFAQEAVRLGGSVAGEHGIGRIKKKFLPIQFGAGELEAMRAVKRALDPDAILNPGVLFDLGD
jgi:D-lactate dehydrogenase (cytochrome)